MVIADEAHRCAGPIISGIFATVLDEKKIKAKKKLFMTATPRYFTERVKKQAEELEYEIASMDDENLFGPTFHTLNFGKAIKENLLSDYQVVIIGVTNKEEKLYAEEAQIVRTKEGRKFVEEGQLVRTPEGILTDARTLSAQIGLAKAIKKYNLRKIITFHSTINKARVFTDEEARDSLKYVVNLLPKNTKPSGTLWTRYVSGEMPTGQRSKLLEQFRALENNERGILSNCACLSEGVDVPALDGIAFIDPKRSVVDIIQAVGRVIRKSEDKKIGTVITPVFIDEKEDEEETLSSSVFEPVWKILKALRAHDDVLGDELDELRAKLGKLSRYGRKIKLPPKIKLDIPTLILLSDFEKAFFIRAVNNTTTRQFYRTYEEAQNAVLKLNIKNPREYKQNFKLDPRLPSHPGGTYKNKGWKSWTHFFTGKEKVWYSTYQQAQKAVMELGINSSKEYQRRYKEDPNLFSRSSEIYRSKGWKGWTHFLSDLSVEKKYTTFDEAHQSVLRLKAKSASDYKKKYKLDPKLPERPDYKYRGKGWRSWSHFLTNKDPVKKYESLTEAQKAVMLLGIQTHKEYKEKHHNDSKLPTYPDSFYKRREEWRGWEYFFTGCETNKWKKLDSVYRPVIIYMTYKEAQKIAMKLGVKTVTDYKKARKSDPRLPSNPATTYKNKGYKDWLHFLTGKERYSTLNEARKAVKRLKIKNSQDYKIKYKRDLALPPSPETFYKDKGWKSWTHFFTGKEIKRYLTLGKAQTAIRRLGIKSYLEYLKKYKEDPKLPGHPATFYKSWKNWKHFITGIKPVEKYKTLEEARKATIRLGITTNREYKNKSKNDLRLPSHPDELYRKIGWKGWTHFLTGLIPIEKYNSYLEARKAAISLNIKSPRDYKTRHLLDPKLPGNAYSKYINKGWRGWTHFLGKS